MANSEKPKSRARVTRRITEELEHDDVANGGNDRHDSDKMERVADTTGTPKTEGDQSPDRPKKEPAYFEKGVRVRKSPRENVVATGAFRTLAARFDPNDPREQPAEHWTFTDRRMLRRGHI